MDRKPRNGTNLSYRAVGPALLGFLFVLLFSNASGAAAVTLNTPADGVLLSTAGVNFTFSSDFNPTSCSLYANASTWGVLQSGNVTSFFHTFTSDAGYLWAVSCTDANQTVFSTNRTLRLDSTAPSAPTGLAASGHTPANLTWAASSDASSITYEVFRNGTSIANTTSLTFSENVPSATTHDYSVRATDAAGLTSSNVTVSVQGPSAVLTLSGFAVAPTSTGATFVWTASSPANASVSYGTGSTVLVVSNPALGTSASLTIGGLSPVTTYSYNATACASASSCATSTGTFRTLPSSYPSPSFVQVNGSAAGSSVTFSAYWSDSLNLSAFIFSSNASGSWTNASAIAFNGTYSNHTLVLPSTAVTVSWLFYANNSQGAMNRTAQSNLTVIVPVATATPTPIPTPTPAPTPIPTVPPELVRATATPQPAVVVPNAPSAQPVASTPAPVVAPTPKAAGTYSGSMGDLVVDALDAEFALSPTGLVIGVSAPNASVVLSSNFTNTGDEATVFLRAILNGSVGVVELLSQPVTVEKGATVRLETVAQGLPAGTYDGLGQVVLAEGGSLLSEKAVQLNVRSYSGRFSTNGSPALMGFLVVVLALAGLFVHQVSNLKNEFAK